jgi:hypothetical protein
MDSQKNISAAAATSENPSNPNVMENKEQAAADPALRQAEASVYPNFWKLACIVIALCLVVFLFGLDTVKALKPRRTR